MADIIDVSFQCGEQAGFLAGAGVKTIIRYYSRDTAFPLKRLTLPEAQRFAAAGLRIGIVHEARFGNRIESFSKTTGEQDGGYARPYGATTIGQPANTTVYFGVDLDATDAQIQDHVLPFFQGVTAAFAASNELPTYKTGVYGSGLVCRRILDAGLAEFAWLAQSRGWAGFKDFLKSNRWSMRQAMPDKVGEIQCDPDIRNPDRPDIGDFLLDLSVTGTGVGHATLTVIARQGLRLRAGPGTDFDVLRVLPFATPVHPVKSVGDWTLVDLAGGAAVDGFVNSHFLAANA